MWSFRESREQEFRRTVWTFTLGALGGLAIGVLLSTRREPAPRGMSREIRERVGRAAAGIKPGRTLRAEPEDAQLTALENAVLDAFLAHDVLSERGVDVGAISRGVIELSGTVWAEHEADEAVRVANTVPGVQTVVNRLEVESDSLHLDRTRRRFEAGDPALRETRWEGRNIGMGRMRQGRQTEPDRRDDSQWQQERALARADRDEWEEERVAAERPRMGTAPEDERPATRPDYTPNELDNQDPHRAGHAPQTLDDQPQELRTSTRVGEGLKPGTELRLEESDVPLKPHSDIRNPGDTDEDELTGR